MFWSSKSRARKRALETEQRNKIEKSQRSLLDAATSTADAAQNVTLMIKRNLEESIRQFNTTTRMLSDAFIICDTRGLVRAFNPAAEQMFGYATEIMIRKNVTSLFLIDGVIPQQREELWSSIDHDLDGLNPLAKLRGRRASGQSFPIETTLARLDKMEGGEVHMILVRDLTDLASAQSDVSLYQQRYRTLFDLTFDGILIVQNEEVVAANATAGIMFKRSPESLQSTRLSSLVDAKDTNILKSMDGSSHRAFSASSTLQDGTALQLLVSGGPILWNDQKASLITVKTISERTRLGTDVLGRRDNLIDMIVCFDADYAITFANDAFYRMTGFDAPGLIGHDIRDLFSDSERDAAILNLKSLTPELPTRRIQVHVPCAGGARLQDWIDHATFDDAGNAIEYQRCGRDITDVLNNLLSTEAAPRPF